MVALFFLGTFVVAFPIALFLDARKREKFEFALFVPFLVVVWIVVGICAAGLVVLFPVLWLGYILFTAGGGCFNC